ncbi:MAG: hypothetical protein ACFFBR_10115 [Promethearchaeota archaeon]
MTKKMGHHLRRNSSGWLPFPLFSFITTQERRQPYIGIDQKEDDGFPAAGGDVIQLIGILANEGVPVRIRTLSNIESASVLGGIIEVLKGLSSALHLGQVQRLQFKERTLLVIECEKGYSIVALADKAEEYVEGLLRIIRIAIDESNIAKAKEPITELMRYQIDEILDFHLQEKLEVVIEEAIDPIWLALLEQFQKIPENVHAFEEIDNMIRTSKDLDDHWEKLAAKATGSLSDALNLAFAGQFDQACAIALKLEDPLAQLFAVKTGLLALSMTRTAAPPRYELRRIAETLPLKYQPYSELAYAATLYYDRLMSFEDYVKIYQTTAARFKFRENQEDLIFGFLFVDTRVATLPDFAMKLAAFFEERSPILYNYILAMLDREQLFSKLYSVTSYDEFKDQVSSWKTKISSILEDVQQFLQPEFLGKLLRTRPEAGVTGSLNLGTYIALYTALAESPVLNLRERKEVLEEVLWVYTQYFRKLLQSTLPLFTYTVDSVFQSLSVVLGEMYYLLSEDAQQNHITVIKSYLQDVLDAINEDWLRKSPNTSTLFVMSNATFPVLMRSKAFDVREVRFIYLAIRCLNTMVLMKSQELDQQDFVTDLLNIKTSLASLAVRHIPSKNSNQYLEKCVNLLLQGHRFFITHGILCRDDIASATLLTGQLAPNSLSTHFSSYVDLAVALNRIAVPDVARHESDIAVLATPYLGLLMTAKQHLQDKKYVKLAKTAYTQSIEVWKRYGFDIKAQEFEAKYATSF